MAVLQNAVSYVVLFVLVLLGIFVYNRSWFNESHSARALEKEGKYPEAFQSYAAVVRFSGPSRDPLMQRESALVPRLVRIVYWFSPPAPTRHSASIRASD